MIAVAALACALLPLAQGRTELATLVRDLGDERDYARRNAAYRELISSKPPAAIPLLVAALPGWGRYPQGLGVTLLRQFPRAQALPALERVLRAKVPYLRVCAAVALYRLGERSHAPSIAAALSDAAATPQDRQAMLLRLQGIGEAGVRRAVRALLVPGVAPPVLEAALYLLLDGSGRGGAEEAVTALLDAPETSAASRAICTAFLVAAGASKHAGDLAKAIASGAILPTRIERFLNRAASLDNEVVAALVGVVEADAADFQTLAAIRLLGRFGRARGLPALRKLVEDPEPRIRKAALEALAHVTGALEPKSLLGLLASDDPGIALVAADTLRRLDDPSGLPRVVEIVRAGGAHEVEAVRVLAGFRARKAVAPLIDALLAADPTVRLYAFQGLGRILAALFPYRRVVLGSTGYSPTGSEASRRQGVAKIRAWWSETRR